MHTIALHTLAHIRGPLRHTPPCARLHSCIAHPCTHLHTLCTPTPISVFPSPASSVLAHTTASSQSRDRGHRLRYLPRRRVHTARQGVCQRRACRLRRPGAHGDLGRIHLRHAADDAPARRCGGHRGPRGPGHARRRRGRGRSSRDPPHVWQLSPALAARVDRLGLHYRELPSSLRAWCRLLWAGITPISNHILGRIRAIAARFQPIGVRRAGGPRAARERAGVCMCCAQAARDRVRIRRNTFIHQARGGQQNRRSIPYHAIMNETRCFRISHLSSSSRVCPMK